MKSILHTMDAWAHAYICMHMSVHVGIHASVLVVAFGVNHSIILPWLRFTCCMRWRISLCTIHNPVQHVGLTIMHICLLVCMCRRLHIMMQGHRAQQTRRQADVHTHTHTHTNMRRSRCKDRQFGRLQAVAVERGLPAAACDGHLHAARE